MKEFLEFEKLKEKLARPVQKTGAKVIINESEEAFAEQFLFQTNYYDFQYTESVYRNEKILLFLFKTVLNFMNSIHF